MACRAEALLYGMSVLSNLLTVRCSCWPVFYVWRLCGSLKVACMNMATLWNGMSDSDAAIVRCAQIYAYGRTCLVCLSCVELFVIFIVWV